MRPRAGRIRTRRSEMNSYQTSIPRAALTIAAIALTALTIGVSVVAPAKIGSGSRELAVAARESSVPTPVVIEPASIEVVAARDPAFIRVHVRSVQPTRNNK